MGDEVDTSVSIDGCEISEGTTLPEETGVVKEVKEP